MIYARVLIGRNVAVEGVVASLVATRQLSANTIVILMCRLTENEQEEGISCIYILIPQAFDDETHRHTRIIDDYTLDQAER